jgi:response regulator RpfG family c-di-GMP phosphodiesterase
MGSIGETRSKETGNHVKRVAEYSKVLAHYAGLEDEHVDLIVDASPMHDIGKVAIPDDILHKPAKLTDEEFEIMRTHAELGYRMLCHSQRPLLKTAAMIAFEHHERWDGKGYPRYLKGEEISIEGRITAIADVFDALGSDRVYKKAWSDEDIFGYLKDESGKQFDPNLINIFFEHIDEFLEIRKKFTDI